MKSVTLTLLLAAILIFSAACGAAGNPSEQLQNVDDESVALSNLNGAQNIGEGATVFLFEVTDGEGNVTSWNVSTNVATVGEALVEVSLIEGEISDFGMMVSHVNGIRADFVEDGAWWAFYIDGEMAMVGVDSTDIEEGVTYAFVYTEA